MNIQADKSNVDFNVLKNYLQAEMERNSADQRAIHLKSEASFALWAQMILGHIAESLGISLGYLVGLAMGAYENIKVSFKKGFMDGLKRGRGE